MKKGPGYFIETRTHRRMKSFTGFVEVEKTGDSRVSP
jgi:hypothetical protein